MMRQEIKRLWNRLSLCLVTSVTPRWLEQVARAARPLSGTAEQSGDREGTRLGGSGNWCATLRLVDFPHVSSVSHLGM